MKKPRVLFTNLRSLGVERIVPVIEALNLGFDVVLMAEKEDPSLKGFIHDYVLVKNFFDQDHCLKCILNYHQKSPITGIFSWTDRGVELVAMVGEALNLKTLSVSAAKKVRNKYTMRQALSTVEGLCPKFFLVKNISQLKEAMKEINGKAVLKPAGASGSTAIFQLHPDLNLDKIFEDMLAATNPAHFPMCGLYKNQYICEEYIEGPEVCVDGFICDGQISIYGISDKDVIGDYSLEYHAYFPSNKPKVLLDEIKNSARKALVALELNNAPFHLEGRCTENGFMVLECAGRPAGGFLISHLIPYATGFSCIKEIIKMGTGQQAVWHGNDQKVQCYSGFWHNLPKEAGFVTSVDGIVHALEVPGIQYAIPWRQVGDQILLPPESFSCLESTIIATANNYETLKENIQIAAKKLVVSVA